MIFQMLMPLLTPDVVALLVSQFSHALMPDLTAFSIPDLAPSSRPAWIPSLAAFLSATAQMLGGLPVMTLMLIPAQIIGGLLLADFISGLFHWFEDRYGNPDWPVLGHTIRQNQQHHFTPRSFLAGTTWTRNREVFAIGALFLIGFALAGWLNAFSISAVVFGMFANEIHAAAHRSPKENGRIITALQKTGLLQSHAEHAAHHRKAKDSHYCVMTNFMNPLLEQARFFPAIEALIREISGRLPRVDESVNPRYRRAT
ncbi:MAG: fatty acid desaturase CarF family protein [Hyphomonadaceae bacterium]